MSSEVAIVHSHCEIQNYALSIDETDLHSGTGRVAYSTMCQAAIPAPAYGHDSQEDSLPPSNVPHLGVANNALTV